MLIYKNALLKIKHSLGRFLSLFLIIAIGVGFYAGIHEAIPLMKNVQNTYDQKHALMDFKIVSTKGLTDDDLKALKTSYVTHLEGSYSFEALEKDHAIKVHAITSSLNTSRLIKGRMPQNNNECLADIKHYQLNQKLTIKENQTTYLKTHHLKVVGLITNPLYTTTNYGTASLGNGELYSYIFVRRQAISSPAYQVIYLTLKKNKEEAYSSTYKTLIKKRTQDLKSIAKTQEVKRTNALKKEALDKVKKQEQLLTAQKKKGLSQFHAANKTLQGHLSQVINAQKTLLQKERQAKTQFARAKTTLNRQSQTLITKYNQCAATLTKLQTQEKQLKEKIQSGNDTTNKSLNIELQHLQATQKQLAMQKEQLTKAMQKLNTEKQKLLTKELQSQKTIAQNKAALHKQYTQLVQAKYATTKQKQAFEKKIASAQKKLDEAKKDIRKMDQAKWYIFNRNDEVTGYKDLEAQFEEVTTIANIIPIFFIIIVIMMTSNTMTRLISEERTEMGTFVSLGFSTTQIISTYLFYVWLSTGAGTLCGYLIGTHILPQFVYNCFPFALPALTYSLNAALLGLIMFIALMLMSGVTYFSCMKELKEAPAILLREKAPHEGAHVLFEHFHALWSHTSFSWKVTLRNLSRYKKRTIMTIFGTLGCAMLILLGFGIRDGIHTIGEKQYQECDHYDAMIILNNSVARETKPLKQLFKNKLTSHVYAYLAANTYNYGQKEASFYTMALSKKTSLISFQDAKTKKALKLNDHGAIITQKMAELLNVHTGDTFTFKDSEGQSYQIKVSGICINYVSNYAYMTKDYAKKVYHKNVRYNTVLANTKMNHHHLTEHLLKSDAILSVQYSDQLVQKANNAISGLDEIVVMLVVISSLLAFSVLYNLTSINISERTREIATLKVLGFKGSETNAYIDRETIIAMVIGIILGLITTTLIFPSLMNLIETNDTIFLKTIKVLSYIYTTLISSSFALVMALVTSIKVNKIDMIESLKSVE